MPAYELTRDADIQGILRYTIDRWGLPQAERYAAALESHLQDLASRPQAGRVLLPHRPELRVSRCKHHFVFHQLRPGKPRIMLGAGR